MNNNTIPKWLKGTFIAGIIIVSLYAVLFVLSLPVMFPKEETGSGFDKFMDTAGAVVVRVLFFNPIVLYPVMMGTDAIAARLLYAPLTAKAGAYRVDSALPLVTFLCPIVQSIGLCGVLLIYWL